MHKYKQLWPLFVDGVQLPQGLKARQRHYEETVALSEA